MGHGTLIILGHGFGKRHIAHGGVRIWISLCILGRNIGRDHNCKTYSDFVDGVNIVQMHIATEDRTKCKTYTVEAKFGVDHGGHGIADLWYAEKEGG